MARRALADVDYAVNKSSLYSRSWIPHLVFFGLFEALLLQVKLMEVDVP